MSKIILFNEYDKSEWLSVMTKHDTSQLNKNTIIPYSPTFDPVSSSSKHLLKIIFLTAFFIPDSTISEKWIILMYHSPYEIFLEAGNSQNPLCWIRTTSQVAQDGLEIRQCCCCCHCAVAGCGDVLMCWRLSRCCQCAVAGAAMCC